MVEKNLKAAFHTLGCKLNFSETSAIGKVLSERGVTRAARGDSPDIIVVNTCSVTETADKKGRQLIRRLAARYPEATMVVTGCYAQLKPEEVAALEGVDIVLGSNEKLKAAEYIDKWLDSRSKQVDVTPFREIDGFIPSCERGDRTRYFLKVQDGCDYFCTYCTIPFARGKSRSGTISQLTEMARAAADEGGKEIVITGVNIGDFGKNTGETFFDLIKSLDKVEGIERYRISSIEPNLLTEEIIRWVARESRAFMPHFHIPLQAGSDLVLKKNEQTLRHFAFRIADNDDQGYDSRRIHRCGCDCRSTGRDPRGMGERDCVHRVATHNTSSCVSLFRTSRNCRPPSRRFSTSLRTASQSEHTYRDFRPEIRGVL